jgi:hypothetical protein
VEKILWLVLGGVTFVAALRAGRSIRALQVARVALGLLYVGAGALVNAVYLAIGTDYANFADSAHFTFVRDTWQSVVAPNQGVFITLLVTFEAAVGVLILSGGNGTQVGLWGAMSMHVGLLLFGWILSVWSIVMLVALVLLLRAERRQPITPTPLRFPSSKRFGCGSS